MPCSGPDSVWLPTPKDAVLFSNQHTYHRPRTRPIRRPTILARRYHVAGFRGSEINVYHTVNARNLALGTQFDTYPFS